MGSSPSHMPSFEKVWENSYEAETAVCPICRKNTMYKNIHPVQNTDGAWQRGHLIPKSKGGSNDLDNIRPICWSCNKKCGSKDVRDFADENGYKYDRNVIQSKSSCFIL